MNGDTHLQIPNKLPVLLVTDGVVFPASTLKIPVNAKQNIAMIEDCLMNMISLKSAVIAIAYKEPKNRSRNKDSEENVSEEIHQIATAAVTTQIVGSNWPRPSYTLQVTGLCRVRLEKLVRNQPFMVAEISQLDKIPGKVKVLSDPGMEKEFKGDVGSFLKTLSPRMAAVIQLKRILAVASLDVVSDLCSSLLQATYSEKLSLLDTTDLNIRVPSVQKLMKKHIKETEDLNEDKSLTVEVFPESVRVDEVSKMLQSVFGRNRSRMPGVGVGRDESSVDSDDLERKLKSAGMPPEVEKVVMVEYKKYKNMSPLSPDSSSMRNYLELVSELPWSTETSDTLDVPSARKDLKNDHFGLEDVKKRVLEYLAVRQLRKSLKGPILCFIGPPGVGKSSIAKSVAKTMGRKFHRISLGGVCDQSELRGHRRTYVGSMPGRIIQGLKIAQSRNPVFLLDEVDKVSPGVHGDPSAALLEILDPEQNSSFVDHYLNVPFDLSQILFLATANNVDSIPAPLLDRMEIISIPGYTQEEKVSIAEMHLVPKQLREHGLTAEHICFRSSVFKFIVERYTKEAGVRSLERRLAAVCRAVALKVAENSSLQTAADPLEKRGLVHDLPIIIDETALEDILGPPFFLSSAAETLSQPGVAAGLYWSPLGGGVLYVEATKMEGDGRLTLTGQLGSVMKESASLALNWIRSHLEQCGLKSTGTDLLEKTDIHIHFPAGAVSKDGPSAGITVLVALLSLFTGHRVRSDTAITGEITLRGLVLPVGGIKEKILSAHRAGFKHVVLPKRNEKDVAEISSEIRNEIEILFVSRIEELLPIVFEEDIFKHTVPKSKL